MNETRGDVHGSGADHGAEWGVSRCNCGVMRVKIGPLCMEFTPEQFQRLRLLLDQAALHYGMEEQSPSSSTRRWDGEVH